MAEEKAVGKGRSTGTIDGVETPHRELKVTGKTKKMRVGRDVLKPEDTGVWHEKTRLQR